jgi:hypothetical protein
LANRSRQTFIKRQKERARQEKQRLKAEKRAQRKEEKDVEGDDAPRGVDPDIAGIVPGPQPQPWEVMDVLTEDEKTAIEEEEAEAAKKEKKKA